MSANKTRPSDASVADFLAGIPDPGRRQDAQRVATMMAEVTGEAGRMWGPAIVGFGTYHYRYASGREGDFFLTGLAPRARALTVYVMPGFDDLGDSLARLGKHATGKSCLYIRRLANVDFEVLREIVARSVRHMRAQYPSA